MPVLEKSGGPYSLFCTDCKTWVPNTANAEMRKEGCFAHSHICGHPSPDEISDNDWQIKIETDRREKERKKMENEKAKREQIFREVQHEYYVEDAIRQVNDFLEIENVDPTIFEGTFDYEYLAETFAENHDCNVADNDAWRALIEEYIKANGIDIHAELQEFEVVISVKGRFRTHVKAVSVEAAKKLGDYEFQEADFGALEDCDGTIVHVEDANGEYHYF